MSNAGIIRPSYIEVGQEDMPLDVYPDPSGRYQELVKTMPRHVLQAACRVIGTHIHIGMPDHTVALKVYNQVIGRCDWLCSRGNGSFGERLDIYRIVAPDCDPRPYQDWGEFYREACIRGFDEDPRKCWTLIRISKHGTIEFRMFGATSSIKRIVGWAKLCRDFCLDAMG
jgi:gamma-glutamyl:cysteine ligase YbdK (ATP-grasp superfamily)